MSRPRISIAGLLVQIAAFGPRLAAVRGASPAWYLSTFLGTIAALLASILGAIFRRGRARAFWVGFALFVFGLILITYLGGPFHELWDQVVSNAADEVTKRLDFPPANPAAVVIYYDWRMHILNLELVSLFALAGGFAGRTFAPRDEPVARDGGPSDPRRTP